MSTKSENAVNYVKIGIGKLVTIEFFDQATAANAIEKLAWLITHNFGLPPIYAQNSIGFYWIVRTNDKRGQDENGIDRPETYNQDIAGILAETLSNYACQIIFS